MSNLSCGTHVAEPSANKDCRKLLNQFCRFLPKLKLPISADAKLPLTPHHSVNAVGELVLPFVASIVYITRRKRICNKGSHIQYQRQSAR